MLCNIRRGNLRHQPKIVAAVLYSVVRQEVESIFNLGIGRKYVLDWIDSHWMVIYLGHENRTSSDVPKQLFCFLFGFF